MQKIINTLSRLYLTVLTKKTHFLDQNKTYCYLDEVDTLDDVDIDDDVDTELEVETLKQKNSLLL